MRFGAEFRLCRESRFTMRGGYDSLYGRGHIARRVDMPVCLLVVPAEARCQTNVE